VGLPEGPLALIGGASSWAPGAVNGALSWRGEANHWLGGRPTDNSSRGQGGDFHPL